jgi:hypothetical protein
LIGFQPTQTLEVIEKNVKNVLAINSGGSGVPPHNFVTNDPGRSSDSMAGRDTSGRGNHRFHNYNHKPRFPWGIDSSPGGGSGSSAGSCLDDNKIPPKSEWETDPTYWDNSQNEVEEQTTLEEDKDIQPPGRLQVDLDFPYKYDDNGNPTLLVPNMGRACKKRVYTKVDYD